jgi:hypothetical protein
LPIAAACEEALVRLIERYRHIALAHCDRSRGDRLVVPPINHFNLVFCWIV